MKLSEKQRIIVGYLSQNETIDFETVRSLIDTHYHNGAKYCSETMGRMCKQGFVVRVSKGVFRLNKNYSGGSYKPEPFNENQINLNL